MKQKKCKNCKGKGYVPVYFTMASRARGIKECPVCKGTGKVESGDKEERKMTKEELEKEADDYADKHAFRVPYDGSNKFYDDVDFKASKEGYLAGAEPREKKIEELKIQNAKDRDIASKTQEQLIKAKELLTRFVMTSVYFNGKETDLIEQTEQFLKECY